MGKSENVNDVVSKVVDEMLKRGLEVERMVFGKMNSQNVEGLVVIDDKGNCTSPILYSSAIIEWSNELESFEALCDKAYNFFTDNMVDTYRHSEVKDLLEDKDYILKNVNLGLCRRDWNEEMLEGLVWKTIEETDLAVYVYLDVKYGIVKVTRGLMESVDLSFEELMSAALKNCKALVSVKEMNEALGVASTRTPIPIKIVTNKAGNRGAVGIIFDETLFKICNELDCRALWVIPSSVHECLVIPYKLCSWEEINKTVKEVNEALVSKEERLSDHVYLFDLRYGLRNYI